MSRLTIIVAATKSNGIGQNGKLPWTLPREIKYFAHVTSNAPEGQQNAVIMGRNTWESIPNKFRPLPHRLNIVITSQADYTLGIAEATSKRVVTANSLESALETMNNPLSIQPIHRGFIIGGASLYRETLNLSFPSAYYVDRVLLTRVFSPEFDCDVSMPEFDKESKWVQASHAELQEWVGLDVLGCVQEENGVQYEFQMWTRE